MTSTFQDGNETVNGKTCEEMKSEIMEFIVTSYPDLTAYNLQAPLCDMLNTTKKFLREQERIRKEHIQSLYEEQEALLRSELSEKASNLDAQILVGKMREITRIEAEHERVIQENKEDLKKETARART